jgi:cytochrome oxidase Cu insertion factor (SCO1/SenC/PrrC family)
MRWSRISALTVALLTLAFLANSIVAPAFGQSGFDRGPAVGDQLPDISGYDAAGKPVELAQMKGSYTVLVFGCLT